MTDAERKQIDDEIRDLRFDIAMEADCYMVGAMEARLEMLEKKLAND